MSLDEPSGCLRTTVDTVRRRAPIWAPTASFRSPKAAVPKLKRRRDGVLLVGVAWPAILAIRPTPTFLPLETLIPLLRTPGVEGFSLQKGPTAEQLSLACESPCATDAGMIRTSPKRRFFPTLSVSRRHLRRPPGRSHGKKVLILLPFLSIGAGCRRGNNALVPDCLPDPSSCAEDGRAYWSAQNIMANLRRVTECVSSLGKSISSV